MPPACRAGPPIGATPGRLPARSISCWSTGDSALAGRPRLASGALLLVHDFWDRAVYRAPLLRHFDLAGSAGTLALLTPKPMPDPAMLSVDLIAHAFDPG